MKLILYVEGLKQWHMKAFTLCRGPNQKEDKAYPNLISANQKPCLIQSVSFTQSDSLHEVMLATNLLLFASLCDVAEPNGR